MTHEALVLTAKAAVMRVAADKVVSVRVRVQSLNQLLDVVFDELKTLREETKRNDNSR